MIKRFIANITVLIFVTPLYILGTVAKIYDTLWYPVYKLIGKLKVEPYKWFVKLDTWMCNFVNIYGM